MNTQEIVALASRWVHIVFAMTLVGGILFMRMALLPARRQAGAIPDQLQQAIRARWSRLVMLSALMLIISGVYNLTVILGSSRLPPSYHALLGIKLLFALAIFFLSSILAGRTSAAKRWQQKESLWLTVNLLLALALVALAGAMKQSQRQPKEDAASQTTAAALAAPHDTVDS